MGTVVRVGSHEVEFLPPRTIRISWTGDVSAQEARTIASFLHQHTGRLERSNYVTDVSRLGKMPADAGQALITRPPRENDSPCVIRLGFAGANVRTKMIMSMLIATANLTSRDSLVTRFFSSIDDAIAWAMDDVTGFALVGLDSGSDAAPR